MNDALQQCKGCCHGLSRMQAVMEVLSIKNAVEPQRLKLQTRQDVTAGQGTGGQGHGTVERPWTRRSPRAAVANNADC